MIRIRFHGRGGHGVKTASRITGSAAFAAGHEVQDSPIYGAERRGAPVRAFTRISDQPILERGEIVTPDLIVLADQSLLHEPAAGVLGGQESAAAIFVNARDGTSDKMTSEFRIAPPLTVFDLTTRTFEILGRASALSAGLAAAAIRLSGAANREQLRRPARRGDGFRAGRVETAIHHSRFEASGRNAPSILLPGNAEARHTGAWRVETPVIDYHRCLRCGLCLVRCPDGAIALDESGYPVIDYDHCKGCMLCRNICPVNQGITTRKETDAW